MNKSLSTTIKPSEGTGADSFSYTLPGILSGTQETVLSGTLADGRTITVTAAVATGGVQLVTHVAPSENSDADEFYCIVPTMLPSNPCTVLVANLTDGRQIATVASA